MNTFFFLQLESKHIHFSFKLKISQFQLFQKLFDQYIFFQLEAKVILYCKISILTHVIMNNYHINIFLMLLEYQMIGHYYAFFCIFHMKAENKFQRYSSYETDL